MGVLLTLRGSRGKSPAAGSIAGKLSRRSLLAGGLAALIGGRPVARAAIGAASDVADTSPQARDEAIHSLPLSELTAETRRKLMAVCERPTLFRRLPQKSVACDPALHTFLVRNPEVVVNIWQLMEVASMSADRQGPFVWKGNDGAGTTCDVELVYGTDDLHVIYSDGYYEGALLKKKVTGRCVIILKSGYGHGPDRRPYVSSRLDLFLQLDNVAADVVARTFSPMVGKIADSNFHETCVFTSKLSQTAEQNSPGVQRLAERLTKIDPPVREEFSRVATAVHQRAALREAAGVQRR